MISLFSFLLVFAQVRKVLIAKKEINEKTTFVFVTWNSIGSHTASKLISKNFSPWVNYLYFNHSFHSIELYNHSLCPDQGPPRQGNGPVSTTAALNQGSDGRRWSC